MSHYPYGVLGCSVRFLLPFATVEGWMISGLACARLLNGYLLPPRDSG